MFFFNDQLRAILWAQFKGIYNRFSGGGSAGGRAVYWVSSILWYGIVVFLAWLAATSLPYVSTRSVLTTVVSSGLLLATVFWQIVPVMLATNGLSLDLKRLMVYPIAPARLFAIEVVLRASTGVEVLIVLTGAAIGLMRNPITPAWGPAFILPFILFNLMLSAGVRDLLTRLMSRRGVREIVIFGIVLLSALPQLVLMIFPPEKWKDAYARYSEKIPSFPWPWQAAAQLTTGAGAPSMAAWLVIWLALAAWFGFSQFQRGLRWDADEANSKLRSDASPRSGSILDALFSLPSRLLPDPLASLIEKDLRSLSRAPRFRLIFFMGFSFGLLVWLPLVFGRGRTQGVFSDNILVWISLYAALLLGEVLFWNAFGFERSAAQAYYVMPVKFTSVLIAKNITAVFFLLLEVTIVTVAVLLFRVPFPLSKIPEAYAVSLLLCVFLLAIGNLMSTHHPRAVDANQSWRNASSGKVQGLLFLLYPLLAAPIFLSYLARYAFDSNKAFYAVLGSGFLVAIMSYRISLDSSVEAADKRREEFLAALSRSEGPIA